MQKRFLFNLRPNDPPVRIPEQVVQTLSYRQFFAISAVAGIVFKAYAAAIAILCLIVGTSFGAIYGVLLMMLCCLLYIFVIFPLLDKAFPNLGTKVKLQTHPESLIILTIMDTQLTLSGAGCITGFAWEKLNISVDKNFERIIFEEKETGYNFFLPRRAMKGDAQKWTALQKYILSKKNSAATEQNT